MSHADLQSLQIQPDTADPGLAQHQTRFNTLVRELAHWRAALADWKDRMARYDQAVGPVRRELHAAWRQWVLALDDATLQPGLARGERAQLRELLLQAAAALPEVGDDAEMVAVLGRHLEEPSSVQPTPAKVDDRAGDGKGPEDQPPDWEREAAAAAARRAERAARRRAAAALKGTSQMAQEASQSLRDVYRRLASALHPDREPDAQQWGRKTALMQQANQAYAEGNLLVLLELQLQAEQIDAAHLAAVDRRRLQHYLTVLQEQLADLQSETRRLEAEFRQATGLAAGTGLQPRKADRLIPAEARRMRGELLLLQRQTKALLDVETTRRWLRERRKAHGGREQ